MSHISCQLLSCQISVASCQMLDYQLLLISLVIGDISYYYILNYIDWLLIKDTITRVTGVIAWWCMSWILEGLIMVPSCGFQPWGTKVVLLPIQLSVVKVMPRLRCYTSCLFVCSCGLQLLEPCGLFWFSVRGIRLWYRACMIPFQSTCITFAGSYNNDNIVWYVKKWLWYRTYLRIILVRLIITNQTSDICWLYILSSVVCFTIVYVVFYL